jgi:hypothetical protein
MERAILKRVGRSAVRILAVPAIAYGALMAVLFFQQDGMVFPGARSQGQKWAQVGKPPAGAELLELKTQSGERV